MHRTLGATVFNAEVTLGQGFGVEFMCAFMLMLVISAVNDEQRPTLHATASISVGLTVIALVCSMVSPWNTNELIAFTFDQTFLYQGLMGIFYIQLETLLGSYFSCFFHHNCKILGTSRRFMYVIPHIKLTQ